MRQYESYQHYKGGIYLKIGEALHTETEEEMVVYVSAFSGKMFVRPKEMFFEMVEYNGETMPRFKKIHDTIDEKTLRETLPRF